MNLERRKAVVHTLVFIMSKQTGRSLALMAAVNPTFAIARGIADEALFRLDTLYRGGELPG